MSFDPVEFPRSVAERVSALERDCDAEIVVVVRSASGEYGDVDLFWTLLAAVATLILMVHGPWLFHANALVLNSLFTGCLFWLASRRLPAMRRALTSRARRRRQVDRDAHAAFIEEGVDATRGRTGILFYLSLLEREAVICPDRGLRGRVPEATWQAAGSELDRCRTLVELERVFFKVLDDLRAPLACAVPATPDNPNELADVARMEL